MKSKITIISLLFILSHFLNYSLSKEIGKKEQFNLDSGMVKFVNDKASHFESLYNNCFNSLAYNLSKEDIQKGGRLIQELNNCKNELFVNFSLREANLEEKIELEKEYKKEIKKVGIWKGLKNSLGF